MTDSEIQDTLDKLRKKAPIPDYKWYIRIEREPNRILILWHPGLLKIHISHLARYSFLWWTELAFDLIPNDA